MEFILTPYAREIPSVVQYDGLFNNEQLSYLQNLARENNTDARIGSGGDGSVDSGIRRSSVRWLHNSAENAWLYGALGHVVAKVNSENWNFDLTGFGDAVQLTNYEEQNKGTYGWHMDLGGPMPSRKLSLILQLSDPVEYEGGYLEFMPHNDQVMRENKRRGLITIFPSWILHQVTPVTKGLRQTLVLWVTGPMFK